MAEGKSRPPTCQNLSKYLLFCAAVCHSHQVSSASDTNHRQPRQHLLLPSLLPLPPPPLPATAMTLLFRSPATAGLFGSSNTATYLRGPGASSVSVSSMALLPPPFHHPRPITTFPGRHYKLINLGLHSALRNKLFLIKLYQTYNDCSSFTQLGAIIHFGLESPETIQN